MSNWQTLKLKKMKKILMSMITGLFLLSGLGLTAQPCGNGNGNGPRQAFRMYMEQNIKPELLKQKKIWMDALTKEETEELLKINEEKEAVRGSMRGQVTPENRDNIQEAHFTAFKSRIDKIVDAHPDLKKEYTKVMTQKKAEWTKDLDAIRVKNNLPERHRGPQNIMEKMTDPAFILLWNPNMNYEKMAMQHRGMNRGQKMGRSRGMRGNPGMGNCGGMNKRDMNRGGMNKGPKVEEPGIHVFPQPATATTIIKISGVRNTTVQADVYNAKGKKVKELYKGTASMPMLDYTLNVSDWDNGIYTVKVTFGNRTMTMDFEVAK